MLAEDLSEGWFRGELGRVGVGWIGEFNALQADGAVLRNNCIRIRSGRGEELHVDSPFHHHAYQRYY